MCVHEMAIKNQWNGMVELGNTVEYHKCYTMHQLHASDLFHLIAS